MFYTAALLSSLSWCEAFWASRSNLSKHVTGQQHSGNFKAPLPTNISCFPPGMFHWHGFQSEAVLNRFCLTWKRTSSWIPSSHSTLLCVLGRQVKNLLWSCWLLLMFDLTLRHLVNAEREPQTRCTHAFTMTKHGALLRLSRGWNILGAYSIPLHTEHATDYLNCFHNKCLPQAWRMHVRYVGHLHKPHHWNYRGHLVNLRQGSWFN